MVDFKKYLIPRHAYLGNRFVLLINMAVAASAFYLMFKIYLFGISVSLAILALILGKMIASNGCADGCSSLKTIWQFFESSQIIIQYSIPLYLTYFTRISLFTYFLKKPLIKPDEGSRW